MADRQVDLAGTTFVMNAGAFPVNFMHALPVPGPRRGAVGQAIQIQESFSPPSIYAGTTSTYFWWWADNK